MLKTASIKNLIVEFEYLTVDFDLNLTRHRLGLDLRACKNRHLTFWVGILRDWNFNSFLFKENLKWQEYFYALYKTTIDCSLIGKLCKIAPLVDWRLWAYISLDFVSGSIVAHGSSHHGEELFCFTGFVLFLNLKIPWLFQDKIRKFHDPLVPKLACTSVL